MEIRVLKTDDIERICEVDRTEHVTLEYTVKQGALTPHAVDIRVPRWSDDPEHAFSYQVRVAAWRPVIEEGGIMLGALDGERLAGFAVLRYDLEDGMSELKALFVGYGYRRSGIGSQLTAEVIRRAKAHGSSRLYVSATPSESAVGFYLKWGFRLAQEVHPVLFAQEPDDIHMILEL